MIVRIVSRKNREIKMVYIKNISEVEYKNGVLDFVQYKGEWLSLTLPSIIRVNVFNDFEINDLNSEVIENPTLEKLNKALKLDEL